MTAPRRADARGNGGKPTPGPWKAKPFDEAQTVVIGPEFDGGKRELVAIVSVGRHSPHGEANARLIAAAPQMFDALTALVEARRHADECGCDDDCDVALDLWRTVDRLSVAALTAASPAADDAGGRDG